MECRWGSVYVPVLERGKSGAPASGVKNPRVGRGTHLEKSNRVQKPADFAAHVVRYVFLYLSTLHDQLVQTTMAQWFAYGEDPLTYWVLLNRLEFVLDQLGDTSDPGAATIFYRPSFGRSGSNNPNKPRAEFGEFDAIVATPESIYPIEAKWCASPKKDGTTITLSEPQVIRHRVFAWYHARYIEFNVSWDQFIEKYDSEFREAFPGKKLAPSESILADNIQFVLQKLALYDEHIVDVLLYIHPEGSSAKVSVNPNTFVSISVPFTPDSKRGIFRL